MGMMAAISLVAGCIASAHASSTPRKKQPPPRPTLWQVVDTLSINHPFTKKLLESTLSVRLREKDAKFNTRWNFFSARNARLADGVHVQDIRFSYKKSDPALAEILLNEIKGICLTEKQVESQYGPLTLLDSPREYTHKYLYQSPVSWGYLTFSFQADSPHCLISVGFRMDDKRPADK
ncbi:MAG: hypothetical protein LBE78_08575 [Burkholderiaceae bacterium]|jgi:hypothetical protein|nr:hypothetical protein [Burkholderiaceae bacterium]